MTYRVGQKLRARRVVKNKISRGGYHVTFVDFRPGDDCFIAGIVTDRPGGRYTYLVSPTVEDDLEFHHYSPGFLYRNFAPTS